MDFKNLGISTRKDLLLFIDKLDSCSSTADFEKNFNPEQSSALSEYAKNKSMEELRRDIKSYFNTYKDIVVYLSFEPSTNFMNQVCDLFPGGKNYLIDFKIAPDLIAGVKISKDGKIYDDSFISRMSSLLVK